MSSLLLSSASFGVALGQQVVEDKATVYEVGVAKVDITPDYPIRLNGFLMRKEESRGVRQQVWAKALAIGSDRQQPAVLITVDALGIPAEITAEIQKRVERARKGQPIHLAITASHSHTAPMINGCAPNIFGEPIPADAQAHIDRYTQEFTDKLEAVALAALRDRRPSTLHWGIGEVTFAKNRRDKQGPFDHDLPMLAVRDEQGEVRAIYVSYACHCVTLSEPMIGGDWAGFAQQQIEKRYPKAVAMVSIGCAGDQNPSTGVMGDRADLALGQGEEIAVEVDRLLAGRLRPVAGPLTVKQAEIDLAFQPLPSRERFEELAKQTTPIGYHARVQLAKLDRGEKLREHIDYPVHSWSFGDSLAMVFLAGEVVSEYGLRLKSELDGRKLWVNAYANACPGYIPSEKVLKVGGYEGGGAMIYYDQPSIFASGLEQQIIDCALEQLKTTFPPMLEPGKGQGTRPRAPEQSLKQMRTHGDLQVDLVVAEPLVTSPVAVDFGPDGKVWIAEMFDYPSGTDGDYAPAGRVRMLESSKDDGVFDRATVFLDGIPFPTGVTVWRKGVLVCAAPDILYAEDTDGDGRADVVRKLFSGFGTDNYQARVNSLEYGLDGWIYGSCGLFGGTIKSFASAKPIALGDRDFRINPDSGAIEPATGRTQQGRVRDDFGNWFGCNNSALCFHYPLADH
ncbi:MAG: neutral/alkaline non-lysosomal ceramidase N-terminal domain-containing protein, partial [Aureliella sp.]